MSRLALRMCLIAIAALALCACMRHTARVVAPAETSPAASSAAGAVRRFEWCWQNRDAYRYSGLLADDFVLVPAVGDSSANAPPHPWDRAAEMATIQHMFVGDHDHAAAAKIELAFDKTLIELEEPIAAWQNRWHRFVRTTVDLRVTVESPDGTTALQQITGFAAFHLVRGDSAQVPPAQYALGVRPDSTRWWIERCEDETLVSGGGLHALPTHHESWYHIRRLYF